MPLSKQRGIKRRQLRHSLDEPTPSDDDPATGNDDEEEDAQDSAGNGQVLITVPILKDIGLLLKRLFVFSFFQGADEMVQEVPDDQEGLNESIPSILFTLCDSCEFSTNERRHMEAHKRMHTKKETFQCPRCTFSAKRQEIVDLHLAKHHWAGTAQAARQGVKEEAPEDEETQPADRNLNLEESVQLRMARLIRQQIEATEEKIRPAQDELDAVKAKLEKIRKRKTKIQRRKDGALAEFRSLELEAVQFRVGALDSPDSVAAKSDLDEAENKVRTSLAKVEEKVAKLRSFQDKEAAARKNLETAEKSLLKLQKNLKTLQNDLKIFEK